MYEDEILLPSWAVKYNTKGYSEKYSQLCTKDGRKIGNAIVMGVKNEYIIIKTDIGNVLTFTTKELSELFYPPKFIVNKKEVNGKF